MAETMAVGDGANDLDMLAAAQARGIKLVMLNTNGIRLARDPCFAPALAEIGAWLDAFDPESLLELDYGLVAREMSRDELAADRPQIPHAQPAATGENPSGAR
jgi:hypothetical protein